MNTRKEVAQLLRKVQKRGYVISYKSKHIKILDSAGKFVLGVSKTPSDPLALKRIKCDLYRAGCLERR